MSGNVSLYNETADTAIYPTPTIGCVGVLDDVRRHARMTWREGDQILLIGGGEPTLGGSEYLASMHGQTIGSPPSLDLEMEAAVQQVVRNAIASGEIRTAHDISLGGLAVGIAEMAIHSGIGAILSTEPAGRHDEYWFGERSASILVAVDLKQASAAIGRAADAGVSAIQIGTATGTTIKYGPFDSLELTDATRRYESALVLDRS